MEWRRCPGLTAGTLLGHASQALLARRLPSVLGGAAHSPDQGTVRSARYEPRSLDPRVAVAVFPPSASGAGNFVK